MILSLIILFILFLVWSILMLNKKLDTLDSKFYSKIKITNLKTQIFKLITSLASAKFVAVASIILLLLLKPKVIPLVVIIDMLIMWCLISILKHTFKRQRPNINRLVKEKGYSYPSGHTLTATTFYSILSFLIIISSLSPLLKTIIVSTLIMLILLIGYTRVYLGVHYLSDVIGAILFSTSYTLLYIYFTYFILRLY